MRIGPSKLAVGGASDAARRYQRSASWWRAALNSDVSVPLAPRLLTFPAGGDAGCIVTYQDAARGLGTGYGGFAPLLSAAGEKRLPFVSGVWPNPKEGHTHALPQLWGCAGSERQRNPELW